VKGAFTGGTVDMPDFRLTSPHVALSQIVKINDDWSLVPSAGVRFYDHNKFESKTAPHAGLSLVSNTTSLFANVSRGINYPGLEAPALQAALPFMFAGNTWHQLSPEESIHQEIGVKFTPTENTQVDVSLFNDKIKNRYVYDLAFGSTAYYNTGGYRMNGAELSIKQNITSNWVAFGGLTLLDPSIGNLPYTPEKAVTAGLNGQIGQVRVAIDAQYQDEVRALNRSRDTLSPNTTKVGAFAIVNARLSYPLAAMGKKGEVFLAVENLFDRDYEYRPGYAMPGVSGQLGLSASF
jgi:iron complex outermembrane receptor protein